MGCGGVGVVGCGGVGVVGCGVWGLWGVGVWGLWGVGVWGLWGVGVWGLWGVGVWGLWGVGVWGCGVCGCVGGGGCGVWGVGCVGGDGGCQKPHSPFYLLQLHLLRIETKIILNPGNNSPEERERHRHCPLRPSQMFSAPTVPFVSQAQGLALPSKFLKKPTAHLSHRGPVKPSRQTQTPGGDGTGTRRGRGRDEMGTGQGRDGDGAGTGQGRVITNASGNRVIRESLCE